MIGILEDEDDDEYEDDSSNSEFRLGHFERATPARANTISVVRNIKQLLPQLEASLPASIQVTTLTDLTTAINRIPKAEDENDDDEDH